VEIQDLEEAKTQVVAEMPIPITVLETHHQEANYKVAQEASLFRHKTTQQVAVVVVATTAAAAAAAAKVESLLVTLAEAVRAILEVLAVLLIQTDKVQDNLTPQVILQEQILQKQETHIILETM